MLEENLKTITGPAEARYTDRGSRFYAFAFPVMDTDAIERKRSEMEDKYPDATHHCYAWRHDPFQPVEFAQDDGEPGGTAGLPILGVIKSQELVNVLIIVIRYYGGSKLGKPGLIHAYRTAAEQAVAHTQKTALDRFVPFVISYPYEQENRIQELINRFALFTENEIYLESVTITAYCRKNKAAELRDILGHLRYLEILSEPLPECFRPVGD